MLKPINDQVVVKLTKQEEKTASGILLPGTASKEKPQTGLVVAVGTGKLLDNGNKIPLEVKEGDKVLFAKYSGSEIKYEDCDYLILKERDILAIIE